MAVTERIHKRSQRPARVRQPVVAPRVEQNLVFSHYGTEQYQHVPYAQLVEEQIDRRVRDGQGLAYGGLQRLPVTGAYAETHLGATGRGHLDAAEYVTDQGLQRNGHVLYVNGVDYAQAVLDENEEKCFRYCNKFATNTSSFKVSQIKHYLLQFYTNKQKSN